MKASTVNIQKLQSISKVFILNDCVRYCALLKDNAYLSVFPLTWLIHSNTVTR